MDFALTLKIVQEYVKQYQTKRQKKECEKSHKGIFSDILNQYQVIELKPTGKYPDKIVLENSYKEFFIEVKESKTQYNIKIWYAN